MIWRLLYQRTNSLKLDFRLVKIIILKLLCKIVTSFGIKFWASKFQKVESTKYERDVAWFS